MQNYSGEEGLQYHLQIRPEMLDVTLSCLVIQRDVQRSQNILTMQN